VALNIPGYEIIEQIGKGGMAEVYRARHSRLERDVALKVMHTRYSDDPTFAERFMREARIAANLNHPNIVQIYDVNRADETLYLAMEYVNGGDLTHNFRPPINQKVLLSLIAQLCDALDFAHGKGYIHRDIKPANILFRENGSLALTDFGIAKAIHSNTQMTQTGTVIGTPSYMSPEQAQGLQLSGRSDLYSAAVIVYQYVTGELPYQADSSITVAIKHISDPIPTLPETLQPLQRFFDRALAKQAEARFENGQTFYRELTSAVATLPVTTSSDNTTMIVVPDEDTGGLSRASATLARTAAAGKDSSDDLTKTVLLPAGTNAQASTSSSTSSLTDTMRYVFIQLNKVVVNIFPPSLSTKAKSLLVGVVLCSLAGLAFLVFQSQRGDDLSERDRLRVAQLLVAADENARQGKLVTPTEDNAIEKYRAVLALVPDDQLAIDGIDSIADRVAGQAHTALNADQLAVARERINSLSQSVPEHEALEDLKLRLQVAEQASKDNKSSQLQLARHLATQRQYADAVDIYHELNREYPNHPDINAPLDRFANGLLEEFETHVQSNRFERASALLESTRAAISLSGNDEFASRLTRSEQQLKRKQADAAHQARVDGLLAKAGQAMKKYHMDSPRRGSANEYFDKVLAIAPGNRQAIAGKERVLTWLEGMIKSKAAKGDIAKAESYVQRLQALQPRHPRLKALKKTVAVAEKSVLRKQKIDRKVDQLFAKADIYLERGRARSADKIHRKIRSLDPNDRRLQALGLRIADGYAELAQRELDAGDWRDVEVWVSRGRAHAPNHSRLKNQLAEAQRAMQNR